MIETGPVIETGPDAQVLARQIQINTSSVVGGAMERSPNTYLALR